ncbi:MAG: aldo/keto reductase [Novosphingobium sp.]|nr:aldo/keto reductase [Novosphingobium sp.]
MNKPLETGETASDPERDGGSDRSANGPTPASASEGKKRRRRRNYLSAAERKQQILRAAQDAFARSSLHGASTREIAKAADINPATLFEHFGSKEALFRESVVAPLIKELQKMRSRVSVYQTSATPTSLELAEAGVQKQMTVMKRLFPLFTTALFSDLETGQALYREHFIPLIEERMNMTLGLAKPGTEPYFLELAVVAVMFFVAMDETFGDGRLNRATAAEQLVRLITFGTAPRPHESASTRHPLPGTQLHDLRQLGKSDMWVSPLALEAVDFGAILRASSADKLREVFELYIQRGGNFVETTNFFADEKLEALAAELIRERRSELVLASHHRLLNVGKQPRKGGTYRYRLARSVEDNLVRLGTDCIDLLYLNGIEEGVEAVDVVDACNDLIKDGKIRYAGFSGVPAWQVARIQTVAEGRGKSPFVALRAVYGATARSAERDLFPMAFEMDLGVTTSAPVERGNTGDTGTSGSELLAAIASIAAEVGKTPEQVALAWKFLHPGIVSDLIHPHSGEELDRFIAASQIDFSDIQIERLETAGRTDLE